MEGSITQRGLTRRLVFRGDRLERLKNSGVPLHPDYHPTKGWCRRSRQSVEAAGLIYDLLARAVPKLKNGGCKDEPAWRQAAFDQRTYVKEPRAIHVPAGAVQITVLSISRLMRRMMRLSTEQSPHADKMHGKLQNRLAAFGAARKRGAQADA